MKKNVLKAVEVKFTKILVFYQIQLQVTHQVNNLQQVHLELNQVDYLVQELLVTLKQKIFDMAEIQMLLYLNLK